VASALLFAPQAAADPGDVTHNHTNNSADVSTDACDAGFVQVQLDGFPETADNYQIIFGSSAGDTDCFTRVRFVGFAADGRTPVDTGYHVADSENGAIRLANVYRCHVEFGVRRANDTFFTTIVRPKKPEVENCPAV
jgi:hypothetical protein